MNSVTVNGNTYTDGRDPITGLAGGGHAVRFVPLLSDAVVDFAAKQSAAAGSAAAAATQAGNAAASAASAVNAPGTNATSTTALIVGGGVRAFIIQPGKSLMLGASVKIASTATPTIWMHGDMTAYNSATGAISVNVTSANGTGNLADWTVSLSGPAGPSAITRSPRTANSVLVAVDKSSLIDATSGTYSQTITAAATLGNGWFCYVGNSGTGFVTLDPNAAETISANGFVLPTWVLWPGEMGILVCNGVGFNYYQITKGEIVQTIGAAVASVSFAGGGMAYRRRMSLSIEDLTSTTTVLPELKINATASAIGKTGFGNNAGSVQSGNNGPFSVGGGNDIKAGAAGIERLNAQAMITPGPVNTFAVLTSKHTATAGASTQHVTGHWTGISETTITSIDIVSASSTIATGTLILREL